MMLSTMGPNIVFIRLSVVLTCWIVAELLCLILVKIEFHSHPLSIGSHAKKGTFYPIRRLNSMALSYTTDCMACAYNIEFLLKAWKSYAHLHACDTTKPAIVEG